MEEDSVPSSSGVKTMSKKKNDPPPRKTLRVDDPLFEETVNQMLLESDLSSDEEEDMLHVEEGELNRRHESDEESDAYEIRDEVIEHESSSSSSDNVPLSELTATNYYYGKNRYKWAKKPASSRVRTPQHNIVSFLICQKSLANMD
ncbi:PREDICTED: uncharacterized protein LOC108362848 [Rhagoletis zephyria]|uniref:uncharacterized protein LOC108362848 n=1 Tax=Rhagoletis zephyria TaxID=28612 RepID=UPI000811301B|nr:PREDICTED: uncharacterized protein LOC108362848 [Rhagoletis zephyria]